MNTHEADLPSIALFTKLRNRHLTEKLINNPCPWQYVVLDIIKAIVMNVVLHGLPPKITSLYGYYGLWME